MTNSGTRLENNLDILDELRAFFEENPDQRFHQGLLNLNVLSRIQVNLGNPGSWEYFYLDETHTESSITLKRIKQTKEKLNEKI